MNFLVFVSLNLSFIVGCSYAASYCAQNYRVSAVASKKLTGSWGYKSGSDVKLWGNHPQVMEVVAEMTSKYNKESNSLVKLEPQNVQIEDVYYQLVAGMNYCVRFKVFTSECKNKDSENEMTCKGVFRCEGEAFMPLPIAIQGVIPGPEIKETDRPLCVKL